MNDGLTPEERVQLNVLMRKQAEHQARIQQDLANLCASHFERIRNDRDEIISVLSEHADSFVTALKPFCKASKS